MKSLNYYRHALGVWMVAAMMAGCGGSQAPVTPAPVTAATRATHVRPAISYRTLHSFGSGTDGAEPLAGLIDVNGTLYGTTEFGGTAGRGTVYGISKTGAERLLHSFGGVNQDGDGAHPAAGLRYVNGKLYGTTRFGGDKNKGTVFSIGEFGVETVVYSFLGLSYGDGSDPVASLRDLNGTLYGTTLEGGNTGGGRGIHGTVYSVTPDGTETVLHTFSYYRYYGSGDGAHPTADLRDVSGTFYGTTLEGGDFGKGTVYSISTTGTDTEKVLHSFGLHSDGGFPSAGLREVNGTLYGTTSSGGDFGEGTVFSITTTGTEKVLHSFGSGTDGANPEASLRYVSGTFYGTTSSGGEFGEGTVYSITTTGTEKVLHSFGSGTDGKTPKANLLDANGTLYGTTSGGGASGAGTVFSLIP